MSTDPGFDLVLAGTGLGVYTLATAFHAEYGIRSTVVTRVAVEAQRRSVACETREIGAKASDLELIDALLRVAAELEDRTPGRPRTLMANEDHLIELFAEHREVLAERFELAIPSDETLARIVDKAEFELLCRELEVPTPRTDIVDFAEGTDVGAFTTDIPFPVVAKVAKVSDLAGLTIPGYRKVYFLQSEQELRAVLENHRSAGFRGRLVVQELIPGDDTSMWSITAYADHTGAVTLLSSARVLLEEHTPEALGRPAAMITCFHEDALAAAERLLTHVGHRGFANFDVKQDPRTGELVFFEVNPRIGRNNFYVTAAGANIARFQKADCIDRTTIPTVRVTEQILYSLVPMRLLKRYVLDEDLWAQAQRAAKQGVKNPWAYRPDGVRAWAYAKAVALNHVRKYRRFYPEPTETGF